MKFSWIICLFVYIFAGFNGNISIKIIDSTKFDDNYLDNNADNDLPTLDMISRDGYPAEAHIVTTEDGYLLSLHRIPGGLDSQAVFLQHGLLGSSADWVISGRGKALAYLLYDSGYDVWLGNARGNTYSRAHIHWSIDDAKFWNFTFHEMGIHDLTAVIPYVTNLKHDKLIYIGHSMGTTMGFVMASERPDIASNIRFMISLAPVAFMKNIKSPLRIVAPFASDIEIVTHFLGVNEFLPQNIFIKYLAKYGCKLNTVEKNICENIMFAICGFDETQFNMTLLPVILGHTPAGSSIKNMLHFAQQINSGQFQQYDYGARKNLEFYNTTYAPSYNVTKFKVPLALFYADNDWLAAPKDVKTLYGKLRGHITMNRINDPHFNHLDFLWAIDARKLVYNQVLALVNKYTADLIQQDGYEVESHDIITEDGYVITIQRIPGKYDSIPVLMLHGFCADSEIWIMNGKNHSLPYILADTGFDVWLGNVRGNSYGKSHIYLSPSDPAFWNFSIHELGMYDLPRIILYINELTRQQVIIIGYSMGASMGLIMNANRHDMDYAVRLMIYFGPPIFMNTAVISSNRLIHQFNHIKPLLDSIGIYVWPLGSDFIKYLAKNRCPSNNLTMKICTEIILSNFGYDHTHVSHSTLEMLINHITDTTSTMVMNHFVQWMGSGYFRQYDYGILRNIIKYKRIIPPDYDLIGIKIPTAIFCGKSDAYVSLQACYQLYNLLPNKAGLFKVDDDKFSHLHFGLAENAHDLVYKKLLNDLILPLTSSQYDLDIDSDVPHMIRRAGYEAESHFVTTEDGYIIEIHRIPGRVGSIPVFLQHGLFGSSNTWVLTGKNHSLVYLLADEGYDVWIGNIRGSTYGKVHMNMTTTDPRFFNFSIYELGMYDLTAEVSYVNNLTSKSLILIPFSMGSPMSLIMSSERPEMQSKVRLIIHLAPGVYMSHFVCDLLGISEMLPTTRFIRIFTKYLCNYSTIQKLFCKEIIMTVLGFNRPEFDTAMVPIFLNYAPDTTSLLVLMQYAQWAKSANFCRYDYGERKNLAIYNSTKPPNYNISKVKIPSVVFYANNDLFVPPVDAVRLYDSLSNKLGIYKVDDPNFTHTDFRFAIHARSLVYNHILKIIKDYQ
ncbi:hypothetical protein PV325_013228 [Microctonus aethiopoides]|nr:hypothetical protein PV325_013228 [Microctonus aethiopoides]